MSHRIEIVDPKVGEIRTFEVTGSESACEMASRVVHGARPADSTLTLKRRVGEVVLPPGEALESTLRAVGPGTFEVVYIGGGA